VLAATKVQRKREDEEEVGQQRRKRTTQSIAGILAVAFDDRLGLMSSLIMMLSFFFRDRTNMLDSFVGARPNA
jgi:hypothetical protein